MSDSLKPEKKLRRGWLRVFAFFTLALAISLLLLAWTVPSFLPKLIAGKVVSSTMPGETMESWDRLTLEEKVKHARVIIIAEYRTDGEKLRAIVKKVMKERPDAAFPHEVGNEYEPVSIVRKPNTNYGEEAVVLIYGPGAQMHESYGVYGGSIIGLGNMPMSRFIELVANKP